MNDTEWWGTSEERIQKAIDIVNEATPSPWMDMSFFSVPYDEITIAGNFEMQHPDSGASLTGMATIVRVENLSYPGSVQGIANAALVVAAPDLVKEVIRLREENRRFREENIKFWASIGNLIQKSDIDIGSQM